MADVRSVKGKVVQGTIHRQFDSAEELLKQTLKSWGLGDLLDIAKGYLNAGYDMDTIGLLLQQTDQYKKRFAGNEARKKLYLILADED